MGEFGPKEKISGLVKKGLDLLKRSNPEKRTVEELDLWIKKGLQLIREEKFSQALDYFEDEEMVRKIGFQNSDGVVTIPIKPNVKYSAGDLEFFASQGADRCYIGLRTDHPIRPEFVWSGHIKDPNLVHTINEQTFHPNPTIYLARVTSYKPDLVPDWINREIALAHAEVWINALQMKNGQPLTEIAPGVSLESVTDAQMYLAKNRVEVTDRFINNQRERILWYRPQSDNNPGPRKPQQ